MAFLQIKGLSKSFKGQTALDDVSIDLKDGETLCLIGDSGSGKTTLLRILNGLESKDSGTISLLGKELYASSVKKTVRNDSSHFGLVFQDFNLFPHCTVEENIILPYRLRLKKELKEKYGFFSWGAKEKKKKSEYGDRLLKKEKEIEALEEAFNLKSKMKNYPGELSGGEKQRAAILRAFCLSPEILCFDEPTSALDPRLRKEVASSILSLKKRGKAMIIVTHEMELALEVADRIDFISQGRICEIGDKSILLHPQSAQLMQFLSLSQENNDNGKKEQPAEEGRAR